MEAIHNTDQTHHPPSRTCEDPEAIDTLDSHKQQTAEKQYKFFKRVEKIM